MIYCTTDKKDRKRLFSYYPKSVLLYLSTSSGTWSSSSWDHSDLSSLNRSDSDNSSVDAAGDAVDLLDEKLWESVLIIS